MVLKKYEEALNCDLKEEDSKSAEEKVKRALKIPDADEEKKDEEALQAIDDLSKLFTDDSEQHLTIEDVGQTDWIVDPSIPGKVQVLMEGREFDIEECRKSCNLRPAGDHILVRRRGFKKYLEVKKDDGKSVKIHTPGKDTKTHAKHSWQGTVIYAGPDVLNLKPGDEVLLVEHQGRPIRGQNRESFYVTREENIYGVIVPFGSENAWNPTSNFEENVELHYRYKEAELQAAADFEKRNS